MSQAMSHSQRNGPSEVRQLPEMPATEKLLPLPEVELRSGFKSSFIYQLIKQGKFPRPVKIGNASRWRESEVQQWIQEQIAGGSSGNSAG